MNPVIIEKIAESPAVQKAENTARRVRNGVLIGVAGILLLYGGYRLYKKYKKSQTSQDDSPEAVFAKRLLTAFSPSGTEVLWLPDGTNRKEVFAVAYDIVNTKTEYLSVQKKFKDLTGKELDSALRSELSVEDYNKFIAIVQNPNYDPKDDQNNPDYYKNRAVIFETEGGIFKKSNDYFSYAKIPARGRIGNASSTGKTDKLVDVVTNGIIWSDIRVEMKTPENITFWVSMKTAQLVSSIDQVPPGYKVYTIKK
jgi:hypothetical protein